jgi:hypothetical protein
MEHIRKLIGLRKEAVLLDSWLYIFKSMLAIGTGFILGSMFSVTRLDMISVLLGVMYNLEATNISAVKGGVNQLLASFLGAVTTGILVYFFGVNVFTIMLGMGFTLYMALKIDYRAVSPVAIFTSIYMTQYIQSDALGNPSIFLTIRLRILALGLGVLIAIIFNFIFSFLYYRRITSKRLQFVKLKLDRIMKMTAQYLTEEEAGTMTYNTPFSQVFADIEIVASNIDALMKEPVVPITLLEKRKLDTAGEIIRSLKVMAHLAYDTCYAKDNYKSVLSKDLVKHLLSFNARLEALDFLDGNTEDPVFMSHSHMKPDNEDLGLARIHENLDLIYTEFNAILEYHQRMG